jgi:acyl-[acyl-carrier-protein]-phospholipid O-acyltransferase/long-chain-fatty-acid--[acyl-carrier-protein] ligase
MRSARHSQPSPLRGLLVAQFLGAFNDCAFKLLVPLLALRAFESTLAGHELDRAGQLLTAKAFLIFQLPLIVFSIPAGVLADRLSKRTVLLAAKGIEVLLMLAGCALLALEPRGGDALFLVLGGLGLHSALFAPAKYGILPELVPHERLSASNGLLEMWTMIAIIAGTASGGGLLAVSGDQPWIAGAAIAGLAVAGWIAAFSIPRVPAAGAARSVGATVREGWVAIREGRVLRLAILGQVLFWLIGSALGQIMIAHSKTGLGLSEALSGLPLAAIGIGLAVGALAAARLSGGQVELGLVPLGGLGLTACILLLGARFPGAAGTIAILFGVGLTSGLLVIPLNALIQWRSPDDRRGSVLGLANVLVYAGMLVGTIVAGAGAYSGLGVRTMVLALGALALLGTLWALWLLPEALLRLSLVILTRTIYRLRVDGRANVPETGGVLLAPNHVAMVDGLFLMAALDRPIRFLVDTAEFNKWWQRPFMRALDAIPISASAGPREILRALRDAGQHLADGHVVCIFPEGQLTRTGMMQPFRRGMERIAKGRGAPIVPVHLGGVWGSIFSGSRGRFVWKLPERIPYPVSVSFGAPLPPETTAAETRRAVLELGEQEWRQRIARREPLQRDFMATVRRRPWKRAVGDQATGDRSRVALLASAIVLARTFRGRWKDAPAVGILLPPSVASVSLNVAACLANKPSLNLNYTAGPAGLASAARQAGVNSVITSRAFLEKAKLTLPPALEVVLLEEVAGTIGGAAKLAALLRAWLAPPAWIERACGAPRKPSLDDVVTIIFSSGSTGEPKGVPLTHRNLTANIEGVAQVTGIGPADGLLGILPTFHSFGFLAMWVALNHGAFLATHPNPLDAGAVGELVESKQLTLMIATPTFLTLYMRRVPTAQFGSLRLILAGAEKLPDRLALAFEDQFGIRPIEGYGTTECSPVVAVSTPTVRKAGIHQVGSKRGSVGQALPGVSLRIVDPESFAALPSGQPGMLLVKGASVMQGYLGRPDLTAQVLRDGWYVTGDIATLDDEGFLRITDRLSRFSKIGGEMVPHGRVEEALHQAAGADAPVFAVTAVPDERKGERLAVLTTLDAAALPGVLEKLAAMGLPNLFLPRLDSFVHVEALPVLGTGKTDLKQVKQIALAALTGSAAAAPRERP